MKEVPQDERWWVTQAPKKRVTRSTHYHEPARMVTSYYKKNKVAEATLRVRKVSPQEVEEIRSAAPNKVLDPMDRLNVPVFVKGRLVS